MPVRNESSGRRARPDLEHLILSTILAQGRRNAPCRGRSSADSVRVAHTAGRPWTLAMSTSLRLTRTSSDLRSAMVKQHGAGVKDDTPEVTVSPSRRRGRSHARHRRRHPRALPGGVAGDRDYAILNDGVPLRARATGPAASSRALRSCAGLAAIRRHRTRARCARSSRSASFT